MKTLGLLFAVLLIKEGVSAFCSSRSSSVGKPRNNGSSHLFASTNTQNQAKRAKAVKSSQQTSDNQSKLAKAAKSLVEAASLEVDSESQKQTAALLKKLSESQKQITAKIDTLSKEVRSMKAMQEKERKDRRIELAMTLTHLQSFEYLPNFYSHKKEDSENLANEVLGHFLLGYGVVLPPDAALNYVNYVGGCPDENEKESARREFREKFKKQIKNLIQRQPRMVNDPDDGWIIAYK